MRTALTNGLCWLGSSRPNIFKMPFMSQLTGLDNSQLLPPYFPAFRGEDSLFGAMLVAMHHHSVSLEYPWSGPHLPLEARSVNLEAPVAATGGISLFARYLTEHIDYKDATDPQQNLEFIVQDTLRMAARTDTDLLLDYRAELARGHADQLYLIHNQLARTEKFGAAQWQDYLRARIDEVQQAISKPHDPTGISGVPGAATRVQLIAEFRRLARGFAAGLAGWVAMRDIASALADEWISARRILPR
jgi:hypothetical protein